MVRRRSIAVVAVAGLALAGLAGCRVEPGTAAFVGGTRISDARVDKIVKEAQAIKELQTYLPANQTGDARQSVLEYLVVTEAGKQYAQAHHVTIKPVDVAAIAQQQNVPADVAKSEYFKAGAEFSAVTAALQPLARSAAPSEQDQREAYKNAGVTSQSFDSVRQYFTEEAMGPAVGLRNLWVDVLKGANTSISPRYGSPQLRLTLTVAGVQTFLGVPLEATPASPAVVDAR